ncbi:hypothetical protein CLAFUW4_01591 [Fulvia fulva]|uniref:Uncharacterized protein n=1 Tax=Passalora fulva TaxID=5499 RepID=A0A9Q8L6V8_PASFU|nr:uncharacterized protein CLAFUR5_01592 [Fulvia fulva]KAK4635635.1 hypothetical protein CLAFUR4_01590 [Fulvia fulva]KAK4637129.1 hypothetical protein CLAFUR0_01591 [Fulvia fulva]UJO11899.1 hypothetical protein CLAFUR5_01592 [Fulvia fulva]WPV09010.1 hypothetical protein CLAFUW4_01591 [Fulvia fulva]WPV24320.1 hypothetical protein CLAFUW7_01594 [Fulvia fulva]
MQSNAHHEIAQTRRSQLHSRAQAFCDAFLDLSNNPPEKILSDHFTHTGTPKITEHGPAWASKRLPFLGRTFSGKAECLEYFSLLAKTLEFQPSADTFTSQGSIVVDDRASVNEGDNRSEPSGVANRPSTSGSMGVVSVKGKGTFKAVQTGKAWDEEFIWRLSEYDEDGGIGHWEIWADPLSAWVAVGGEDVA